MDRQFWHQVEQVFYQALEQAAAERQQFVRTRCADNKALYQTVMQLLCDTERTVNWQQKISAAAASIMLPERDLSGSLLGHYRLLRPLGHGGMGSVYLAERADQQFDKRVAIKLVNTQLAQPVQAFKNERQILANLEHAYIARLFDAGTTHDGLPYLVMEYVQGKPIDQYCQLNALSVGACLQLFIKVLSALAYAHQNMVVHCDLKPSNILISRDGEPKLLDFGIAHLLNRSAGADDDEQQMLGLTQKYAAPEQKRGAKLSALTDVYSAGKVLQQLLPPERRLAADLKAILAMALAPEPQARYRSVLAFSDDIRRFLTRRPVLASKADFFHHSWLYVQRNTTVSLMAVTMLVALLGFSAALWQQAQQLAYERDEARTQRDTAQAITGFVGKILASVDPAIAQGHEPTISDALANSAALLQQTERGGLAGQPEVEAAVRQVIGQTYFSLGKLAQAKEQLETAWNLLQRSAAAPSELHVNLVKSLADLYQDHYKNEQVLQLRNQQLKLAEQVWGTSHRQTLGAISDLASAYHMAGQLEKALQMWQRLYRDRLRILGPRHADIVHSQANLGIINHWLGDYPKAIQHYQQCLNLAEAVLGKTHPRYLQCLSTLGSVYETSGQFDLAQPVIEQHLQLARQVLSERHPDTLRSMHNLADTYRGQGKLEHAEQLFRQTLALRQQVLGEHNVETLQTQMKLARLLMQTGQLQPAAQLAQDAYDKHLQQLGASHPSTLIVAQIVADIYLAQENATLALDIYQQTLTQRKNSPRLWQHPDSIELLTGLSRASLRLGQLQQAQLYWQQARVLAQHYPGFGSPAIQLALQEFAEAGFNTALRE